MPRRLDKTPADYVTIAVSPVLIMTLVGSLVFFLQEVFYTGGYTGRVSFILGLFVMAIVLIGRISIEDGNERAVLFALPLAIVVGLAIARFSDGGLLHWGLMALCWWSAHKLTWDCTVIDEEKDASGQGLMQIVGLDGHGQAEFETAEKDPLDEAEEEYVTSYTPVTASWEKEERKKRKPHAPGVWIVFFSLAALPLFGIGQRFIPVADVQSRRHAFMLLLIYVASGLGLLLTTSFLGLRRYLRQRRVEMPPAMAAVWIAAGSALIVVLLLFAALLPRPAAEYAISKVPLSFTSPERKSSKYAPGNDGADKNSPHSKSATIGDKPSADGKQPEDKQSNGKQSDQDRKSSDSGKSRQRSDDQRQSSQDDSQEGGKSGDSGDDKSKPGKSGKPADDGKGDSGKSSKQGKSSEQGKSQQGRSSEQSGRQQEKSPESSQDSSQKRDKSGQPSDRDSQQDSPDDRADADSSREDDPADQGKEEPDRRQSQQQETAEQQQTAQNESSQNEPPPSSFSLQKLFSSLMGALGAILKWLFYIAIALIALYWLVRSWKTVAAAWVQFLKELAEFWRRLFGGKPTPKGNAAGEEESRPAPRLFADFADPFATGMANRQSPDELVKYTFEAVEAWARENGSPRGPEQTPHEFAQQLANTAGSLKEDSRTLADLYCFVAYAPGRLRADRTKILAQLWQQLQPGAYPRPQR